MRYFNPEREKFLYCSTKEPRVLNVASLNDSFLFHAQIWQGCVAIALGDNPHII